MTLYNMNTSKQTMNDGVANKLLNDLILIILQAFIHTMKNRTTPYTLFAIIMIINSLGWTAYSWDHTENYYIWEYITEQASQVITLVLSFSVLITYQFDNLEKLYKIVTTSLAVFCVLIGGYWFFVDIFFLSTVNPVTTILTFATDILRIVGGLYLLSHIEDS